MSEAEAQRPGARVREGLRVTRIALGLIVLLGLSSLVGAAATAPAEHMAAGLAAWFFGQAMAIAGVVLALRAIRRARFADRPSTRLRQPSDALLYVAATVGGGLALAGFGPAVLAGHARAVDVAIAAIGVFLAAGGLRAAALYVLRP